MEKTRILYPQLFGRIIIIASIRCSLLWPYFRRIVIFASMRRCYYGQDQRLKVSDYFMRIVIFVSMRRCYYGQDQRLKVSDYFRRIVIFANMRCCYYGQDQRLKVSDYFKRIVIFASIYAAAIMVIAASAWSMGTPIYKARILVYFALVILARFLAADL